MSDLDRELWRITKELQDEALNFNPDWIETKRLADELADLSRRGIQGAIIKRASAMVQSEA